MKNPQCVEDVHNDYGVGFHRCLRQGWKECDGKWYCKQHHPDTVAERRAEVTARHEARWAVKEAEWAEDDRRARAWKILKTFGGDDPLATAFEAVYKEAWTRAYDAYDYSAQHVDDSVKESQFQRHWSASEAKKKLEGMK